jgi:hypothetical protein
MQVSCDRINSEHEIAKEPARAEAHNLAKTALEEASCGLASHQRSNRANTGSG